MNIPLTNISGNLIRLDSIIMDDGAAVAGDASSTPRVENARAPRSVVSASSGKFTICRGMNSQLTARTMEDIVVVSTIKRGEKYVCTGTLLSEPYKAIVLQVHEDGTILKKKTYGDNSSGYEAHHLISMDDGFLVCGCSKGFPSDTGGKDWKAYLLRIDENFDTFWERSYRFLGNECFYSVIEDDGFVLFGQSRGEDGEENVIVVKCDSTGNLIWKREILSAKNVLAGGISKVDDGYIVIFSGGDEDGWSNYFAVLDKDGVTRFEKHIGATKILDICPTPDSIYMTGSEGEDLKVICCSKDGTIHWETEYSKGNGVCISSFNGYLLVGGEIKRGGSTVPVLINLDTLGSIKLVKEYDCEGWIESFIDTDYGYLLFIYRGLPREHTCTLRVDRNGVLMGDPE